MFRRREGIRERLYELIERFRQEGALSPDKAMTAEELMLPPRFKEAMERRLGRTGIFVEVNGKYYLSEQRLKQLEGQWLTEGAPRRSRKTMQTLRMVQMMMAILFVVSVLINIFVQSLEIRVISSFFLVVWLVISVLLVYYRLRARKRILWTQ